MDYGHGTWLASHPVISAAGGVVHLGVAALCFTAGGVGARKRLWRVLGVVHGLLALEAALSLRLWVGEAARGWVRARGWYDVRWEWQAEVSVGVLVLGGIVAAGIVWAVGGKGKTGWACRLGVAGTMLTLGLLAETLVSLHQVDAVMGWPSRWINVGAVLRGVTALMAAWGAWVYLQEAGKEEAGQK